MNHHTLIAISTGALFAGVIPQAVSAGPNYTTHPAGFIGGATKRSPANVESGSGDLVARLCSEARTLKIKCPSTATAGPTGGIDGVATNLPHLRLDIVLKDLQNVVVSGNGVDRIGEEGIPFVRIKIVSASADASNPDPAAVPYELSIPGPDSAWHNIDFANLLYRGVIENGCLGPASFDLTLDSSIHRWNQVAEFGNVHLVDSVEGHGYYNFQYTLRATDEYGNVSDLIYSGDANAFCTGQSTL
ncbi:MAG: hypothetical protein ACJ8OJ_13870 [Povalibacter sp.]|jgi:hypothetical protein